MLYDKSPKTVLVTGCSEGGLGAALCAEFARKGFHVFLTLRDLQKVPKIAQNDNIEVLELDVASIASIQKCLETVRGKTGGGLDVLVNNAAAILTSPLLDVSIEECRKLYEVNVWGLLSMVQIFTPLLIRSKGLIMNIGSVSSVIPLAWTGAYGGSKAAVELMTDVLRIELRALGVRVLGAQIGALKTHVFDNGAYHLPPASYYKSIERTIADVSRGKMQEAFNETVETAAMSLVKDVMSGKSGKTWRGGSAGTMKYLLAYGPRSMVEWMIHRDRGIHDMQLPDEER